MTFETFLADTLPSSSFCWACAIWRDRASLLIKICVHRTIHFSILYMIGDGFIVLLHSPGSYSSRFSSISSVISDLSNSDRRNPLRFFCLFLMQVTTVAVAVTPRTKPKRKDSQLKLVSPAGVSWRLGTGDCVEEEAAVWFLCFMQEITSWRTRRGVF